MPKCLAMSSGTGRPGANGGVTAEAARCGVVGVQGSSQVVSCAGVCGWRVSERIEDGSATLRSVPTVKPASVDTLKIQTLSNKDSWPIT